MDQYVTGAVIRELRTERNLTQAQLARKLDVSDKTISKWETGRGYPDITLLEPIAEAFGVSVTELIAGAQVRNRNVAGNMMKSRFHICPVCGNIIHAMGEAVIHCHGVRLMPADAEPADERHMIHIERVEDEYYLRIDHAMTKKHYISFIAAAFPDRMEIIRLYPEGEAEARVNARGMRTIYYYCNRDGLFRAEVGKRP